MCIIIFDTDDEEMIQEAFALGKQYKEKVYKFTVDPHHKECKEAAKLAEFDFDLLQGKNERITFLGHGFHDSFGNMSPKAFLDELKKRNLLKHLEKCQLQPHEKIIIDKLSCGIGKSDTSFSRKMAALIFEEEKSPAHQLQFNSFTHLLSDKEVVEMIVATFHFLSFYSSYIVKAVLLPEKNKYQKDLDQHTPPYKQELAKLSEQMKKAKENEYPKLAASFDDVNKQLTELELEMFERHCKKLFSTTNVRKAFDANRNFQMTFESHKDFLTLPKENKEAIRIIHNALAKLSAKYVEKRARLEDMLIAFKNPHLPKNVLLEMLQRKNKNIDPELQERLHSVISKSGTRAIMAELKVGASEAKLEPALVVNKEKKEEPKPPQENPKVPESEPAVSPQNSRS